MLRLTFAQMRRSVGRLTAAGIAITIGTAFVAATLLAGSLMTRIGYDSTAAAFADSDLVVHVSNGTADDQLLAKVRGTDGVQAADPLASGFYELSSGGKRIWQNVTPLASDPRLEPQVLTEGALPGRSDEIALPAGVAERLGVRVGGSVQLDYTQYVPGEQTTAPVTPTATAATASGDLVVESGTWEPRTTQLTVVGLLDDPMGAWAQWGGAGIALPQDLAQWSGSEAGQELGARDLKVAVAPGADVRTAQQQLSAALPDVDVWTKDEAARHNLSESGTDVFIYLVLGFAAVALLVSSLVIANTFQVLVAQRTRTLALLRCVGASRSQLRTSVLLEAAVLGLTASAAGVIAGTGLAQLALWVLRHADLPFPLPGTVDVTVVSVLVPLAAGLLVTLAASVVPARAATQVAPIAALRPQDAPELHARSGRVRLSLALLLLLGGAAMVGGGLLLGRSSVAAGFGLAVLGSAGSFIGVLLSAVFWMPRVIGWFGGVPARTGVSARLAAANSVRNPRRTAATSTALLIGVTLVATMSTGAATARATFDAELDQRYPFDVQVSVPAGGADNGQGLSQSMMDRISGVDGVAATAPLLRAQVRLSGGSTDITPTALGISAHDAARVLRGDPALTKKLDDDTLVMSKTDADGYGLSEGDIVTIGSDSDRSVQRKVVVADLSSWVVVVTPATLREIVPDATVGAQWVRLADSTSVIDTVGAIQDTVSDTAVSVDGAALERASNETTINTLLAIVVGLLAVAVVIALVGVANTLSLSVLERRRESATLRAIGLTRRQLRLMLAVEGMLIAGVGAVLGAVLGLVYGWAGASAILGSIGQVHPAVPWTDLGLVLIIALGAGLLASVVPARTAARTSPVAALAVD